jgi:hypothetical protein
MGSSGEKVMPESSRFLGISGLAALSPRVSWRWQQRPSMRVALVLLSAVTATGCQNAVPAGKPPVDGGIAATVSCYADPTAVVCDSEDCPPLVDLRPS